MDTETLAMLALERVVVLVDGDRTFTFRVDHRPPLAFWQIESRGRTCALALRVQGDETPTFFRKLAAYALAHEGF